MGRGCLWNQSLRDWKKRRGARGGGGGWSVASSAVRASSTLSASVLQCTLSTVSSPSQVWSGMPSPRIQRVRISRLMSSALPLNSLSSTVTMPPLSSFSKAMPIMRHWTPIASAMLMVLSLPRSPISCGMVGFWSVAGKVCGHNSQS